MASCVTVELVVIATGADFFLLTGFTVQRAPRLILIGWAGMHCRPDPDEPDQSWSIRRHRFT